MVETGSRWIRFFISFFLAIEIPCNFCGVKVTLSLWKAMTESSISRGGFLVTKFAPNHCTCNTIGDQISLLLLVQLKHNRILRNKSLGIGLLHISNYILIQPKSPIPFTANSVTIRC